MKELSLNVLDIVENSTRAGATLVEIRLSEAEGKLTLTVTDNGCGMTADTVRRVTDPFYTTRTVRSVGLGLPLLKLEAQQTGGDVTVASRDAATYPEDHGTCVTAVFYTNHIDCPPLGDLPATVVTLVQGHPDTDFSFCHERQGKEPVHLDTRELRQILEGVPLDSFEVLNWIQGYMQECYA